MIAKLVPGWIPGYQRAWLTHDVVAGLIIWSVVVPQAVAYAQIAGLPPQAGLIAAPGAMLAYGLLGTSRTLVVSATTATSALSASAVGPLANGDLQRFAELSAVLALLAGAVLICAGFLRLGGVTDLVSKPVMTGFLFGLGLTVAVGQLPKIFGVEDGDGNFFPRLWDLVQDLGDTHWWTLAVGVTSVVALLVLARVAPKLPATLIVLIVGIAASAALDLAGHGVAVVGHLPKAFPDPTWPSFSAGDITALLPAALGVMIVSAEAIGVARALATKEGTTIQPNRDLIALGASNVLGGLAPGFVQSGGASQTAAAERAGGKSQLASIIAAGLILLTGGFLAPLFEDLPEATLAAIVVVAIAGFFRVDELRRFAHIRRSAIVLSSLALAGVLLLGVLPGLLVAAGLSLVLVIQRLSRPAVSILARDPETRAWGSVEHHPGWETVPGMVFARVDGPLFYANTMHVKEQLLAIANATDPVPSRFVLDLSESPDLDVETLDALRELAEALAGKGSALVITSARVPVLELLERSGVADHVLVEATLSAAMLR